MSDEIPLYRGRMRHRLPAPSYTAPGSIWHVTIGTRDRMAKPLADPTLAQALIARFGERITYYQARCHMCCLMPDHAHLIIQVATKGLIDVVRDLKSVTTRTWWTHGESGKLWQERFYDHGIRGVEDFESTVTYILDNPVRAGLAETWQEYPYINGELVNHS